MIKNLLADLLKEAVGPSITFTVFDLIKAIEIIDEKGPIGRGKLSEELKIGGGAIRTLIKRLKDSQLLTTSKLGCTLTNKGSEILKKLNHFFPQIVKLKGTKLTSTSFNFAVLVRNYSKEAKNGLEQRDAAVRIGAKGAVTIVFMNGKLIIPKVSSDLSKDYPEAFNQITKAMKLEEDDIIVIGNANDLKSAEYGALAAAWTLI
jgi:predicted transcriptional regulator